MDDILSNVFSHFDPYGAPDRTTYFLERATCARSARVCRAWTEHAVGAIWGPQSVRLLQLCHILHPVPRGDYGGLQFNGKLMERYFNAIKRKKPYKDPVKWASFLRCGARVRRFNALRDSPVYAAEAAMIQLLIAKNGGKTFLPRLLSVSWEGNSTIASVFSALVPSTLGRVRIAVTAEMTGTQVDEGLRHLADTATAVQKIYVHSVHDCIIGIGTLLAHKQVHKLTLAGSITLTIGEVWLLLDAWPGLESLRIAIKDSDPEGHELSPLAGGQCLRRLRCKGTCIELTRLISHLGAQRLSDLDLEVEEPCGAYSASAHRDLCHAISENAFGPSLRKLRLRSSHYEHSRDRMFLTGLPDEDIIALNMPPTSLADLLRPLFTAVPALALESFTLNFHWLIYITDDDLRHFVCALGPTLKELSLNSFHDCRCNLSQTERPSQASLYHIAMGCPRLEVLKLGMVYDFDFGGSEAYAPSPLGAGSRLRMLRMEMPPLHRDCDQAAFAQLLYGLFPSLDIDANMRVREFMGRLENVINDNDSDDDGSWNMLATSTGVDGFEHRRWENMWEKVRVLQLGGGMGEAGGRSDDRGPST